MEEKSKDKIKELNEKIKKLRKKKLLESPENRMINPAKRNRAGVVTR